MEEAQEELPRRLMVYKYAFDAAVLRSQTFSIPVGSSFLTLQQQYGVPTMWWLCPADTQDFEQRTFVTLPTGPPGTDVQLYYVGTYQLVEGNFVGHVFSTTPFLREPPYPHPPQEEEGMGTKGEWRM